MDFSAPPPGFPPQGMNVPPPTSIPPPNFQNPPPFTDENFDAFEENYEVRGMIYYYLLPE